jgi:hypothetical protein
MPIKKADLHSSIWASCDGLRGSLFLLFIKHISDKYGSAMKTKWGSCNHRAGNNRLNTKLVRQPRGLLEYVIVHELLHLIEPTHNERFLTLMSEYNRPGGKRAELNELPLAAEVGKEYERGKARTCAAASKRCYRHRPIKVNRRRWRAADSGSPCGDISIVPAQSRTLTIEYPTSSHLLDADPSS